MNSRSREKRSHESTVSSPSFAKRVSGLFPSTIINWFSSPSSSNANGTTKHADSTDSSVEDDVAESTATGQPPSKRMRLSPSLSNRFLPTTTCSSTNTDANDFTQTSVRASPNNNLILKRDFMSTSVNPKSEDVAVTTSETETRVSYILKNSLSSGDTSVVKTRKSLYDTLNNDKPNKKEDTNISARDMQDSSHRSLLGSTFYAGRTTYGGARSSTSYLKTPIIKTNKNTVLDERYSNKSLNVSTSARRIMDLLENYSSPLKEARRISQYLKPEDSLNTSNSNPNAKKVVSYKTQELHVPSLATVLSIKRRSRLMDTTSAARQLMASHSSSLRASPYPSTSNPSNVKDSSDKLVKKIKVSSTMIQDPPPPVDLPTAVLEIDKDNLPKFSFISTAPNSQVTHTLPSEVTSSTSLTNSAENMTESKNTVTSSVAVPAAQCKSAFKNTDYEFSKPVKVHSETVINNRPPIFSFVSPEKSVDGLKQNITKNDTISSIVGPPTVMSIKPKLTKSEALNWKCNDCLIRNTPDVDKCVCCGGKKPSDEPKKCSICKIEICKESSDLCSDCKKKSNITDSPKSQNLSKWICQDCWINNDDNKCERCGRINPLKKSEDTKPETLGQTWKCNICLIENKSSEDKCIACLTIKPGSVVVNKEVQEANTLKSVAGPNYSLKNIVQKQQEKWECQFCLVLNDNNKSKCACCEAVKPGATKQSEIKFNFGQTSSTTFKFGIDPKINQVSDKDKNTETKPESKETNNNVLPKSSFIFGIPVSKPDEISLNSQVGKSQEITLPAFSFGICKEIQSKPTVPKDVLTDTVLGTGVEQQEKPQEVPSVNTNEVPSVNTNEVLSVNINEVPSVNINEVNTIGSLASASSTTLLENNEPPKTNITFTATPLFQKNESTPSISVSPLFQKNDVSLPISAPLFGGINSPSSAAAVMPLFQKNEPKVLPITTSTPLFSSGATAITSLPSLFQKNETTTTSQSTTSSSPMFSFGVSTQNTTSTEKPKFNFTFGSNNKIGTSNMFSNTNNSTAAFGVVPVNNSNKFGNTNSTSLSNVMASNASSNGLTSGGNVLGGNGLTENSFGTNNLSSHSLNTRNTLPIVSSVSTNATGLFGTHTPKDNNPWPATNSPSTSLFSTTTASNITSKPSTFTFGGNIPFDISSNNNVSTFGSNIQSTPNVFGISSPNTNTGSLFPSPLQNSPSSAMFGNLQGNNTLPKIGMFGQQTSSPIPNFGTTTSIYEPPAGQSPAPAFNFTSGQSTGVFGFGQQQQPQQQPQQQQQQPQGGVYGFGGTAAPQVQFKVGSGPTAGVRRVRKAVRRTTPR